MKKDTQTFVATIISIPSLLLGAHLFHQGIFPEPLALPVEHAPHIPPVATTVSVPTVTTVVATSIPKAPTSVTPVAAKTVVVTPSVQATTTVTKPVAVKVRRTRAS